MWALICRIVLVSILLFISKNVHTHSLVQENMVPKEKVSEYKQLVDISYISKPSISAVLVLCRSFLKPLHLRIKCPALDHEPDFQNYNSDVSKVNGKCKSTDNISYGCSRKILWKQIENFTNFSCFCRIKKQGMVQSVKHKASVKITKQECKTNTKTVIRRKIKEEKSIHLSCCITGDPSPQITWYKDKFELHMPNGNAVINNVKYQQNGSQLIVSRTDIRGSGNYYCLAKNIVGYEKGGIYQLMFYERESNAMNNGLKQQIAISPTYFTRAYIVENLTEIRDDKGAYFTKNLTDIKDNKEETEENEKQNERDNVSLVVTVVVICILLVLLVLAFAWGAKCSRKRNSSSDENTQHSRLVTTQNTYGATFWPSILCGYHEKLASETHEDSIINNKLVSLDEVPQEPIIFAGGKIKITESSNFRNYKPSAEDLEAGERLLSCYHNNQNSDVTVDVNPASSKIDEELLTHSARSICSAPTTSLQCYCSSSSIEDTDNVFAELCTFCPIHQLTNTELIVDTNTGDDSSNVSATNLRNTSSMPSPDYSMDSNTSELLDKLITIPPNADERYVANSLIDHNGGEVVLTNTGIKLIIPEGAIDFGKTEVVYLALLGNSEYVPKELDDDETLLTPVVMCGPHGLRFKKHVLLIVPHCVVVCDELEPGFQVLCSDTAPEIAPDWKEIFNVDEEPDKDVFCSMGEQQFSLYLLHFSWYVIRGREFARNFSVAAYHTSFHQPNEEFKVRVYFTPISRDCCVGQKKVDEAEKKLQGTLSDGQKIKIFYRKGGDIKIKATDVSDGWQIVGDDIQTEGYKELCHCLDESSPNRTFRFQHVNPRPERISCRFTVRQEKCKSDTPVDISVSLHFGAEIKRAQNANNTSHDGLISVGSTSGYTGSGVANMTVAFIPTELRRNLIEMLDIDIIGSKNWKELADHLGFKQRYIRWLDRRNIESPTEKLLMEWESKVTESPEEALRNLERILWDMRRHDAANEVQTYLNEWSSRKETTV